MSASKSSANKRNRSAKLSMVPVQDEDSIQVEVPSDSADPQPPFTQSNPDEIQDSVFISAADLAHQEDALAAAALAQELIEEEQKYASSSSSSSSSSSIVNTMVTRGPAENDYATVNELLKQDARYRSPSEKNYWYEDFKMSDFCTVKIGSNTTTDDQGKKVVTSSLNLAFNEKKHEYSTIQTPVGVLTFSKVSFEGNMNETGEYKPKSVEDIKQSIQWSTRAYYEGGRDENEPMQDAEGMRFVDWCNRETHVWFIAQLKTLQKQEPVSTFFVKCKQNIVDTKKAKLLKGMNCVVSDDEVWEQLEQLSILRFVNRDKTGIFVINFATKLLRKENKRDIECSIYMPMNKFFEMVYMSKRLLFNDFPIYVIKSFEERMANPSASILKQISRKLRDGSHFVIPNGSLASIRFYPSATNKAGTKMALHKRTGAIILVGPPTELSRKIPEAPLDDLNEQQFPLLSNPPKLSAALTSFPFLTAAAALECDEPDPKRLRIEAGDSDSALNELE